MYTKLNDNGEPIGVPSTTVPEGEGDDWVAMVMPPPRTSAAQTIEWSMVNGECVGSWAGDSDPMKRLATKDAITDKHLDLELSPIDVFGETFDCDEKSRVRMLDTLTHWESLPIEEGVFEQREEGGDDFKVIIWTKADNTVAELSKEQLTAVFNKMIESRAIRAARLFASARRFKENPLTTLEDIESLSAWGV